jgi:hypothetical protein
MGFHLVWQIMSCAGFALIALFLAWSPGAYADANVTAFLLLMLVLLVDSRPRGLGACPKPLHRSKP